MVSPKADKPWFKKKRVIIPGVVVALIAISGIAGAGGSSSDNTDDTSATSSSITSDATDTAGEKPKVEKKPAAKKTAAKPKMTSGQENALAAAENYLSFAPFSRKGMIRQLSSDVADGYSKADATYAADHVDVDYKE